MTWINTVSPGRKVFFWDTFDKPLSVTVEDQLASIFLFPACRAELWVLGVG